MIPERITIAWLHEHDACVEQVKLFKRTFPDGALLTAESAHLAAQAGLDLSWLAERILDAPARQAYKAACAPAWQAYKAACASALQAYKAACAPAWQAYEAACASALQAYKAACAPALVTALNLPTTVSA